jgi:outer membrane protein TolC
MTPYELAVSAHNEAQAKFRPIRDAYRAGRATDEEFLAARRAYLKATEEFDKEWEEMMRRTCDPPT